MTWISINTWSLSSSLNSYAEWLMSPLSPRLIRKILNIRPEGVKKRALKSMTTIYSGTHQVLEVIKTWKRPNKGNKKRRRNPTTLDSQRSTILSSLTFRCFSALVHWMWDATNLGANSDGSWLSFLPCWKSKRITSGERLYLHQGWVPNFDGILFS